MPVPSDLNYWLSRFVVEARHANGQPYPPSSISNLLAGLYRHCQEYEANCPNFINGKDPAFRDLNGALQVRYHELHESGVGAMVKHAAVDTPDEDTLWSQSEEKQQGSTCICQPISSSSMPGASLRQIFQYVSSQRKRYGCVLLAIHFQEAC